MSSARRHHQAEKFTEADVDDASVLDVAGEWTVLGTQQGTPQQLNGDDCGVRERDTA